MLFLTVYRKEKGLQLAYKIRRTILKLSDDYRKIYQNDNATKNIKNVSEDDQEISKKEIQEKIRTSIYIA